MTLVNGPEHHVCKEVKLAFGNAKDRIVDSEKKPSCRLRYPRLRAIRESNLSSAAISIQGSYCGRNNRVMPRGFLGRYRKVMPPSTAKENSLCPNKLHAVLDIRNSVFIREKRFSSTLISIVKTKGKACLCNFANVLAVTRNQETMPS